MTDEYSAAMTRLDLMQGPTPSPTFSAIETSLLLTPLSLDHLLDSHWVETSVLAIVIPISSSTNQKREKGTFEGYGAVAIAIVRLWSGPSPNGPQNTSFFETLIAQKRVTIVEFRIFLGRMNESGGITFGLRDS